ncbi:MAG TPA: PAS domain-containing sensor histidine kinase [Mycobacteriales bacterium]|nr:PAS domain-containing sensor histidine kinase [Mycobacteriales bacterium]
MSRKGTIAVFTALLAAGGLAAGAAAQMVHPAGHVPWAQAPLILGLVALASHLVVRFQCGDDVEALDLFEAVLAPTLVVFPGVAAVALVAAGRLVVGALHRNEGMKVRFNAAQWAAATGCGSLVFAALRSGETLSPRDLAALALAMVVSALVNYATFTGVLCLAGGGTVREVLAGLRPLMLLGWVGGSAVNVAFGLLFASMYVRTPAAVVVIAVPLVVLHWGSRGFATARTDRIRLTGLQAATHALARPIDPRDALAGFLAEVQRCFEADAVDLLETTPNGPMRHRVAGELPYWYGADDGASTASALLLAARDGAVVVRSRRDGGILAAEGWRAAAAAPVRSGDRSFGVLCVYNRGGVEGFEHGETVVLEALAAELAGALVKAELLEGMIEERRQLADIVGNTSDGILTLDERGVVTSWNAGLEQITGHDAAAMLGTVPDTALRPRAEDGTPVPLAYWASGVALPAAVEIVTADHQTRWISCSYTEAPARDGRGPQLVVMARDVTKAHELDKLKDDFVAVVSHELRTPLSPIKGWAMTLLRRGEELSGEQRREGARAILRQADRLEQLILNILEDSRVEADVNLAGIEETVDAAACVAKVVEDFTLLAPERVITVHGCSLAAEVVGRTVRIEQIVANLVANAVKYSPKHEPIEVALERGPGAVLISVTDRGPGIPVEARERVFQRFERLAESPTQTGTGLGLYIARRLATSMGATLDVGPATGGGSTFTLKLRSVRALAAVG